MSNGVSAAVWCGAVWCGVLHRNRMYYLTYTTYFMKKIVLQSIRCSPCHCNKAGIKKDGCDAARCFHCKENVKGIKCDLCKNGTKILKQENPFGCSGGTY